LLLVKIQLAALVSIIYNVGPGEKGIRDGIITLASGRPSTLLARLNVGDYAGAAAQFPLWDKSCGRVCVGLVTRRQKERTLFLTGDV
jgi:lysozyme